MTAMTTGSPPASLPAVPPGKNAGKDRANRTRSRRDARIGWAFLAPFAILFALVFLAPIAVSLKASFFQQTVSGGSVYGGGELVDKFVGLKNYADVVTSELFWLGVGRVLLFGAVQIPVMIGGALLLALLLDSLVVRRVGFFRLSFFLPYAIPGIVAALVWTYIFSPVLSPINEGLSALSGVVSNLVGQPVDLTVDFFAPGTILGSMATMTTWTFTGYNMLIFLAALLSIPGDLYEAARMDGAGEFAIVRWIKIPLVKRAAMLAVLLSIIGTIQLFTEPTVLATVNPWMGKAYTPMMMAYNSLTGTVSPSGDGPASAISIVMALLAALLAAAYAFAQRRSMD
ncbi:MAG: sugar ABC transporter permease [Ornithinimicrobium sp.]|uniref:carbohydrate ABC transporter permease n=1 Tax=Ornithinimicrobium sp. TaxID=1977084 RepID=UPI0026E09C7C|nr:sugar ABC transporter permease [Ornithinimicrobium sp.]MDO5739269.1 sugar ABC transporter permease [Ornithinimicrobium sp.]